MKIFGTALEKKLLEHSQRKILETGTLLIQPDTYIRFIPIVLSGSLRVIREDEDGREILLYYIKPGESCIMSFLAGIHDDTSKVKSIVEEEAEVLLIPVAKAGETILSLM